MMNRKTLSLVLPVAAGLALGGLAMKPFTSAAQTANQQALVVPNSPIQPLTRQIELNREPDRPQRRLTPTSPAGRR